MRLPPFRIERYYAQHEFTTRYMLSSSDCESRSVADLLGFEPDAHERLLNVWCGYTETRGSDELRDAIANIYPTIERGDVLATACAEEAIFILYHAILDAGRHAIVEAPCYGSALDAARSTGATVDVWQRRYEDGWAHDLDALRRLIRPETRVLYINQPHNPTGTLMDRATFDGVVELAREHDLVLFSDEVYRESEHRAADRLPAACDVYDRAVSLGSVSKSYGLPGLRTGWLASHDAGLLAAAEQVKDYTTICAPAPSELLAALALRHREALLERNLGIITANLARLDDFFAGPGDVFEWVRPNAAAIGFPQLRGIDDVDGFCERLAAAGVLLLPGSAYDQPRHVRVGFGRANLPEALAVLERNLEAGS